MELVLIWRVLRRWWWLVLIPVAITAALAAPALLRRGAGAAGGYTTTISYTAAQDLSAIPGRDGDFQDVWLASELAVNALTDWVRSNTFAADVAAQAATQGLTIDPAALAVAADNQRSVGQIFINWPDADQLQTIAQAAVTVLETKNDSVFPQMGGVPARVEVLDAPRVVAAPPPLTDRFAPLIRVGVGLLAGIALAFLANYLDPILRSRDDLESLGLPVIASIPRR